jgi:alpha-galactosidase
VAVGLFNRSLDNAQITVKWSDLGITTENPKVRDLWNKRDITDAATGYSVTVPSHGVIMLRVE